MNETPPEKLTLTYWELKILSDKYWCQCMQMSHKGKDLNEAIKQSFGYLIADPLRLENSTEADFKRFTSAWMSKMRASDGRKEALVSHEDWIKKALSK